MTASVVSGERRTGRRRPRSRATFTSVLGELLLTAGALVLLFVAWQMWIGDIIISAQKNDEGAAISEEWARGPAPEPPPLVETDDGATYYEPVIPKVPADAEQLGQMHIPRFGADYEVPIMPGGNLVEAKGREALSLGVAWYELGERPGEIGNFVVAGHRVTHGEPFADFPRLKAGDKVNVETRESIFTYVLRNGGTQIIVPFTVSWPLDSVPDPKRVTEDPTEPLITMVTCSELFHTANRSVVVGELRSTRDKANGQVTNRAPSPDPWPEPSPPTS
jgi:sortase A